jgi:hypothetical protein
MFIGLANSVKAARTFFASFFLTIFICPAHVQANPIAASKVAEAIDLMRRNLLVDCASMAKEIAKDSPNDTAFNIFLQFVVETGLIRKSRIAEFARVDSTAVSRWLDANNHPSTLVKEIVLVRMAEDFEAEVSHLSKKWNSPPPSVDCMEMLRNK